MENGSSEAVYGGGLRPPAAHVGPPPPDATPSEAEARLHAIDAEWRRAVMESIDDGMLLFDADGLVLEMNQAFVDLFGYRLDEGPFRPPYPWWPTQQEDPETLEDLQCYFDEILEGLPPSREFAFFDRDRRRIWVRTSGSTIQHAALGTTHLRIVHDITREREAQRRRSAAAEISQAFAGVDDLTDLIGIAEHGFDILFDGDCTIQLGEGEGRHWFSAHVASDPDSLPVQVQVGLNGTRSNDTIALRPGILLLPPTRGDGCRAWVQFPRPRRITVDEMVAADLLAAAFGAALDRLLAQQESSERLTNLRLAVESHRLIGQATGILVERHRILPAEAFKRLRQASQHRNVKLRDLAEQVVESGNEPEDA